MTREYAYWMALAHAERMRTARKNEIVVRCFEQKITLPDFFHSDIATWKEVFGLSDEEMAWLQAAREELPNYSFTVEDLIEQGYNLVPIVSPDYPQTLKQNLKKTYSPTLIYTKGNRRLLHEECIAIVGSRNAGQAALEFTDTIATKTARAGNVVVSGYAKGVDKQAFDSALANGGKSIVVLPQGITTFVTGFRSMYKDIIAGNVLVMSAFPPKAPWSTGLAMARNAHIYGMATEIYVAESNSKGGTWEGVIDGLRKKRKIFVRQPLSDERNANLLLIEKGATPISQQGDIIEVRRDGGNNDDIDMRIRRLIKNHKLSSKEIIARLDLTGWNGIKMTRHLQRMEDVVADNSSPKKFAIKGYDSEPTLFGSEY